MAAGALIVEHKFIRGCSRAGRIEGVVVLSEARGQGLGLRVVSALVEEASLETQVLRGDSGLRRQERGVLREGSG